MARKMLVPIVVPSVVFSNGSSVKGDTLAGRQILRFTNAAPGLSDGMIQNSLGRKKIYMLQPAGAHNTNLSLIGLNSVSVTGTQTTRTPSATNMFTRTRRAGVVSSASAGNACGFRYGDVLLYMGDGAGLGGFFKIVRFGCSDAATVAGARQFVGVFAGIAAATDVEPSTLTQCIGIGHGAADTNLKLYYGGSAAQTPIDLGANFPANTLSADLYELMLYAPANELTTVYVRVERLNTGDVFETKLSTTSSAVLPSTSGKVSPINCYRSNGATALAVGLDIVSDYVETDY